MRELDIVFTRSKRNIRIISDIIMWCTNKDISHVAKRSLIRGETVFYQSNEGKVNYEHSTYFNQKHTIVREYTISVPDDLYKIIRTECLKECGNIYGTMQLLGILYVDFMAKFGIKVDTPWKRGRICSELIYEVVFKELIPELNLNPDTIKPHQIEEIILNNFTESNGVWEVSTI